MKKISILALTGLLSLITLDLFSVPAVPWPVEKQLPDGTVASVYIKGDEKVHWMESLDGYTLLYDDAKNIVYATKDADGDLVPSSVHYGKANYTVDELRLVANLDKKLSYSLAQTDILKQIWEIGEEDSPKSTGKSSVLGDKKALCILTSFSNKSMGKTKEQFENLMNQVGYSAGSAKGSVKDFYRENSYGQMDLTVTVVGPYELPNTSSYYGNENNYQAFARAAVQAADDDVDYTQFANENNQLETVHIIFAGYGDEAINNGQQIWSHKWNIMPAVTLDGVRISTYSCSPELRNASGSTLTAIGVICHELCHVFGADDYYDTDGGYWGNEFIATGDWDLMASGSWNGNGDTPAHINMFQKILYEWVDAVELTDPITITNMPNSAENPVAYIIKPYTNNEQYILENRQKLGFDVAVPGKGLIIYHIHNSASSGSINNTSHPQRAYVVAASSSTRIPTSSVSSYGSINSSGAPFASTASRNEFSKDSTPAMFRWNGNNGTTDGVLDKPLTNITQSANGLISFDFMGGLHTPCQPVNNLLAEMTDDVLTLTWEEPTRIADYEDIEFTYSVYCNDVLLTDGLTDLTFTETLTDYGNYNYCVVAVIEDEDCESEAECCSVEYINPYKPVTQLTVEQDGKDIVITWVAPDMEGRPMEIHHYELFRDNESIAELAAGQTEYIDERPEPGTHTYVILTYYDEEVNVSDPVSKRIVVTVFDECAQVPEIVVEQDDDKITLTWNQLDYISSYDVYRNGELMAEGITITEFADELSETGLYEYGIVSYGEECESEPKIVTVDFVYPCDANEIVDFAISQDGNTIRLDWELESTDTRGNVFFTEDFENRLSGWQLTSNDDDEYNWEITGISNRVHSGLSSIMSASSAREDVLFPDNWLISLAIVLGDNSKLSFWRGADEGYLGEHYGVYISTTDRDMESFEILMEETIDTAGWNKQVINLREYAGEEVYIAFRHFNSTDILAVYIDDISLIEQRLPNYNVYENGTLIAEQIEDNFFEKELTETGSYTYEVTYIDYCETEPVGDVIHFTYTSIDDVIAGIKVYPTVTNGTITVETPMNANLTVKDITGRTLDTYLSEGSTIINLDYSPGIYLIMIECDERITTHKIILK
jgi:M6 family metalloprotease domain